MYSLVYNTSFYLSSIQLSCPSIYPRLFTSFWCFSDSFLTGTHSGLARFLSETFNFSFREALLSASPQSFLIQFQTWIYLPTWVRTSPVYLISSLTNSFRVPVILCVIFVRYINCTPFLDQLHCTRWNESSKVSLIIMFLKLRNWTWQFIINYQHLYLSIIITILCHKKQTVISPFCKIWTYFCVIEKHEF